MGRARGVLSAAAVVLLTACGTGAEPSADQGRPSSSPTPSRTPKASYFVEADTTAVNAAAGPAQNAISRAIAQEDACDQAGSRGFGPWRRCWHRVLDPVRRDLSGTAAMLTELGGKDLPAACVSGLGEFSRALDGHADAVASLLAGIDGDDRAAQRRAVRRLDAGLRAAHAEFSGRFVKLTEACYSPADLASIHASPTSNPSSSPSVSPSG